jgi:hypothetical protein
MKALFRYTPGEKAGSIDGLNLFFGALLGANLGTMQSLPIPEYVKLIILLAGTVIVLRMLSTSERRVKVFLLLAVYVVLVGGIFFVPEFKPKGLPDRDLYKLLATLAIWLGFVLISELTPTREPE